ncbi:MAG: tRNA1(Val) (adenine(37)-N6)-methyltransferase [Clostridia bacterium]|nr:tRNA1(Val) (adenine(37)-N6)-methyltransferase [Clostridia bacterium]
MKENIELKSNETLDDLQAKGFKIIQSSDFFKFSTDSVLLSHFASYKPKDIVMDMCSGTGVVALLISAHYKTARIDCVEIQSELFDMCRRSVKYNDLEEKVFPYNMDLRDAPEKLGISKYDTIICNPPYLPINTGKESDSEARKIARFEINGTLADIISSSAKLLKYSGKLVMSHRAERLSDVIETMKEHRIEPKRCRFIHSKINNNANIFLIEGIKNAKPNMIIEPPLIVYDENNSYMDDVYKIYNMDINK